MQTLANPYKHRVRHALMGGTWGAVLSLAVMAAVMALGALHISSAVGVILALSVFAGIVVGWLAG